VIVIILSIFLMTYTYIEAKSNYHRGSILILSYLVLAAGFYFAPHNEDVDIDHGEKLQTMQKQLQVFDMTKMQHAVYWLTSWWPRW
jgi:Ca2+:H+ antiporter